ARWGRGPRRSSSSRAGSSDGACSTWGRPGCRARVFAFLQRHATVETPVSPGVTFGQNLGCVRRRAPRPSAGLDAAQRGRLLDLLRRYGRNPNSFLAMYEGPWTLYESSRLDGGVPYAVEHGTALAWGDPLCAPEDIPELLREFTEAMRERRLRVCMVPV